MKLFDLNDTLAYLQPRKDLRPFTGDVSLMQRPNPESPEQIQGKTICTELVPTREFVQKLKETQRIDNELVDITWIIGNVWFHLLFDRDHLISTLQSNGVRIETKNAELFAFHDGRRYEILLDSSKARFIVFRQHLRDLPPALHNAATELVSF